METKEEANVQAKERTLLDIQKDLENLEATKKNLQNLVREEKEKWANDNFSKPVYQIVLQGDTLGLTGALMPKKRVSFAFLTFEKATSCLSKLVETHKEKLLTKNYHFEFHCRPVSNELALGFKDNSIKYIDDTEYILQYFAKEIESLEDIGDIIDCISNGLVKIPRRVYAPYDYYYDYH